MSDWIIQTITEWGYGGIAFLMFAENIFPPIPSELIMPFAGVAAERGDLNIFLVLVAGTIGSVLGAFPWYYLGRFLSGERRDRLIDRYGIFFLIEKKDLYKAIELFTRFQRLAVFLGRLLPAVRTLISVPAGSVKMPLVIFLLLTTFGSLVWNILLLTAGYLLGTQYQAVEYFIEPITKIVVFGVIGLYLFRVGTFLFHRWRNKDSVN